MSYPLIIFGAGASHDYSTLGDSIAPLTNQLVEPKFLPPDLLEKYPGAGDLLSDIIQQVKVKNRGFEEVITEVKSRMGHAPQIQAHFVALEFYLSDLFKRISISKGDTFTQRMHQVNNYKVIINRINAYSEGKACIVTFNYDSLFERNIPGKIFKTINGYVNGDIKIIKLHGSHDWIYVNNESDLEYSFLGVKNDFDYYCQNPSFLDNLRKKGVEPYHELDIMERETKRKNPYAKFPAMAIPLTDKSDYICPIGHIDLLQRELQRIDRVLIIGWKAGDPLLLKMLGDNLSKYGMKILIVSQTKESAEKISKTLTDHLSSPMYDIQYFGDKFSGFTSNEIVNTFFA